MSRRTRGRRNRGVGLKRVLHVVRARPNFMKVAPIVREMAKYPQEFEQVLVHTEPYYDDKSKVLREDEGN